MQDNIKNMRSYTLIEDLVRFGGLWGFTHLLEPVPQWPQRELQYLTLVVDFTSFLGLWLQQGADTDNSSDTFLTPRYLLYISLTQITDHRSGPLEANHRLETCSLQPNCPSSHLFSSWTPSLLLSRWKIHKLISLQQRWSLFCFVVGLV